MIRDSLGLSDKVQLGDSLGQGDNSSVRRRNLDKVGEPNVTNKSLKSNKSKNMADKHKLLKKIVYSWTLILIVMDLPSHALVGQRALYEWRKSLQDPK